MNYEQVRKLAPQIKRIARKHGIARVFVFGSIARGDATEQSDVDFLVEMQEGASLFGVGGFCYDVEKLLGVPVDVVPLSTLALVKDREFVANIQREAVSI